MTRLRTSPAAPANQSTTTHSAWVKTADAAKLIGLSPSCLKNYRLKKKFLIEGIHWVYTNSGRRTILYNVELLSDWVATRADPEQHQRTIEVYLHAQSSKRAKKRGRQR
jgi:hypothetical protein